MKDTRMRPECYENFPIRIVLFSNAVALSIYILGVYILGQFGTLFLILYVLYCLWVENSVLQKSCVHCYYYGKVCPLGKGKLCSWFFRKGEPQRFIDRHISWKDFIPEMLVLIIPLITGIVLLLRDFTWLLVSLLALLVMLSFGGNAFVRGTFACKYCKQKELGCPAQQLFSK